MSDNMQIKPIIPEPIKVLVPMLKGDKGDKGDGGAITPEKKIEVIERFNPQNHTDENHIYENQIVYCNTNIKNLKGYGQEFFPISLKFSTEALDHIKINAEGIYVLKENKYVEIAKFKRDYEPNEGDVEWIEENFIIPKDYVSKHLSLNNPLWNMLFYFKTEKVINLLENNTINNVNVEIDDFKIVSKGMSYDSGNEEIVFDKIQDVYKVQDFKYIYVKTTAINLNIIDLVTKGLIKLTFYRYKNGKFTVPIGSLKTIVSKEIEPQYTQLGEIKNRFNIDITITDIVYNEKLDYYYIEKYIPYSQFCANNLYAKNDEGIAYFQPYYSCEYTLNHIIEHNSFKDVWLTENSQNKIKFNFYGDARQYKGFINNNNERIYPYYNEAKGLYINSQAKIEYINTIVTYSSNETGLPIIEDNIDNIMNKGNHGLTSNKDSDLPMTLMFQKEDGYWGKNGLYYSKQKGPESKCRRLHNISEFKVGLTIMKENYQELTSWMYDKLFKKSDKTLVLRFFPYDVESFINNTPIDGFNDITIEILGKFR